MRYLILIFLFFVGCGKPNTVFICGDHECINKTEAKQYFEENLTLVVKVIDKKKREKYFDLIDENLNRSNIKSKKIIKIKQGNKKKINVKKLTKKDYKKRLKKVKEKEKNKIKKNKSLLVDKNKDPLNKKISKKKIKIGNSQPIVKKNICVEIKNCNIDEIAKYLLNSNKKKDYPDLSRN